MERRGGVGVAVFVGGAVFGAERRHFPGILLRRPAQRALRRKPHSFQNSTGRRYADPLAEFLEDDVSNHPTGPKRGGEAVILGRPLGEDSKKLLLQVFVHGSFASGQVRSREMVGKIPARSGMKWKRRGGILPTLQIESRFPG